MIRQRAEYETDRRKKIERKFNELSAFALKQNETIIQLTAQIQATVHREVFNQMAQVQHQFVQTVQTQIQQHQAQTSQQIQSQIQQQMSMSTPIVAYLKPGDHLYNFLIFSYRFSCSI